MEEPRFLESDFDADVDLTPLIDVVFMLLLFFILAATFSQPVLEVALPAAGTAHRTEEDPDRLALAIDAGGTLYHREAPLALGDLPALLAERPAGPVELRVDRAAPFDAFVGAMDQLRACGRSNVLIAAESD